MRGITIRLKPNACQDRDIIAPSSEKNTGHFSTTEQWPYEIVGIASVCCLRFLLLLLLCA